MYSRRPPGKGPQLVAKGPQLVRQEGAKSASVYTQGDREKNLVDSLEKGAEAYKEALQALKDHMEEASGGGMVGGFESQVMCMQEIEKVLELSSPIAILHCICRTRLLAKEERNELEYTCLGTGIGMFKWERWPERYKGGVKFLSLEKAKEWCWEFNRRGYVPIIMIYGERFVGGICMCDYPACDAIAGRLDFGWHCLKGHYVAIVDEEKCNGCGICAQRCQWGALKFAVTTEKAGIDQFRCFGCGLCQTACPRGAIEMVPRENIPALKEVW
ncbi:MAG: 4Fe-4S binding protein [Dehalococcoidales bacterium]|nr:4Fe-4S binding protein [Dehalococcoidales bacterium]